MREYKVELIKRGKRYILYTGNDLEIANKYQEQAIQLASISATILPEFGNAARCSVYENGERYRIIGPEYVVSHKWFRLAW